MYNTEVKTITKSLPLLRWNTCKSLIFSYSAYFSRILQKKIKRRKMKIEKTHNPPSAPPPSVLIVAQRFVWVCFFCPNIKNPTEASPHLCEKSVSHPLWCFCLRTGLFVLLAVVRPCESPSGGFASYHAPVMSRLPIITLLSTPVKLNSKCAHYLSGRID